MGAMTTEEALAHTKVSLSLSLWSLVVSLSLPPPFLLSLPLSLVLCALCRARALHLPPSIFSLFASFLSPSFTPPDTCALSPAICCSKTSERTA